MLWLLFASLCFTSTADTMGKRIWRENVHKVSGDLCRSANPCNRTTAFSLSWRAQHMNGHPNPRINIEVESPIKAAGQTHCISWLIELRPAPFSPFVLLQIRHALSEYCLRLRRGGSRCSRRPTDTPLHVSAHLQRLGCRRSRSITSHSSSFKWINTNHVQRCLFSLRLTPRLR